VSDFVATIRVRPKAEVRDPQGEAVAGALRSIGVDVADVRTGKEIVVRFSAAGLPEASAAANRMGAELLANPVIEEFAVEVRATAEAA
jgi:phosphoribosylformylglycinamidine synthase